MGNAPSHPQIANGEVQIVGNTNGCGGELRLPVAIAQFAAVSSSMPCTQQEYQTIVQLAAPLGVPVYCQNAFSKPSLGDQICQQLNATVPSCSFSMHTAWVKECAGEYWEYSLSFRTRAMQQVMQGGAPQPQTMMVTAPLGSTVGTVVRVQTANGQQMDVTVPNGVAPGIPFSVALPSMVAPSTTAPAQTLHSIVVPPGTNPGEMLVYTSPDGRSMQVQVPERVQPGQSFQFNASMP